MSVLFVDGFDHYVTADINRKWDYNSSTYIGSSIARRAGGKACYMFGPTFGYQWKQLPSTYNTVVFGFAFYLQDDPDADGGHGHRLYIGGEAQVTLLLKAGGVFEVRRGTSTGTVLKTSASALFVPSTWYHLEAKFVIGNSGSFEIRLNGTNVLSDSGVDTQASTSAGADRFELGQCGPYMYIDDLFVAEDWLGDCRVDTLMPNGAGNYSQWTPSAGSNYQNVDDAGDMDDDSTYNSEDTAGQMDTYAFQDLEATGGTIHSVAVNLAVRKDDAGTRTVKAVTRQSSTDYVSSAMNVSDTYKVLQARWDTNPADSLAWEESDVNGAEFGIELEA